MPDTNNANLSANSKKLRSFYASQRLKSLLTFIGIFAVVIIGVLAYSRYNSMKTDPNAVATATLVNPGIDQTNPTEVAPTSLQTSTGPQSASPSQGATTAPPTTAPKSSAIPEGVTIALNSIEQTGIKNNPYVTMDTSIVPDGTVTRADRSSWQGNGQAGTVNGVISVSGQTRSGTLTFQAVDGTWKVVGYSMSN